MTVSTQSLLVDADALADRLVGFRRALHQIPEIGLDLPATQAAVLAELQGLPLAIATGTRTTSITAILDSGRPGPTVLLRGDMDALPVAEETGLPWASTNGNMHACGHDLHVAGLLGAAVLLSARKDELVGKVVFMFQPGEEGTDGTSGASVMLDEGILEITGEKPTVAFAVHVISNSPRGLVATKGGPVMAASSQLTVTVQGAGGHGSSPFAAKDPVPAACEMVLALQSFVTRSFDVFDPVVIGVGSIHAGDAGNVIPAECTFKATVRSFSPESTEKLAAGTIRLVEGIAAAHGLTVDATFDEQCGPTINDAAWAARSLAVARELHDPPLVAELENPAAGSEDFGAVLDRVPGCYLMLGAGPDGPQAVTAPMNHSPHAVFDDSVLPQQAALLAALAIDASRRAVLPDETPLAY